MLGCSQIKSPPRSMKHARDRRTSPLPILDDAQVTVASAQPAHIQEEVKIKGHNVAGDKR